MDVIDPATEEKIASVPVATDADLTGALAAADRAWHSWRETDAWSRSAAVRRVADLVRKRADSIAGVLTEEQGKPIGEARAEVLAAADQFDWYADEARRTYGRVIPGHSTKHRLLTIRQSIGPVAAFSPWNFPAVLPARKIAPAVAAGCSIIIKPAEEAPRTALCLAQACHDAEIPPGVVNVVTGDPSSISARLIDSDVIRKVSFTGSVPVARELLAKCAKGIKAVSMELGGHAPVLVFADADVEPAAETAARAKFRNAGQVCIAASRFFVHESIAERFTERFLAVTRSLRIGPGCDPQTQVGPLSSRRRFEATEMLLRDACDRGATVRCGGRRPQGLSRGFFFEPTVLTGVDDSMRIMKEEPFCPIAPIATFTDFEEAIGRANSTEYGLAAYVFTQNTRTAFLACEALDVGMVGVNHLLLATAEAPFGGIKNSGFGREGGSEGIEAYTVTKLLHIAL